MIRSMTGFASTERQHEFGRLGWELRSVNHRYLEIGFRVPEEFRSLEPDIRRILGQHLSRGKVDANLRFTPTNEWTVKAEMAYGIIQFWFGLSASFAPDM